MKKYRIFIFIMVLFITFIILTPKINAASFSFYTLKYKCPVREKPSDQSPELKSGNDIIKLQVNQEVSFLKQEKGPNNGDNNAIWYAVRFDYAAREYTGYVAKACMNDVKTASYSDDVSFENSIKDFPESYKNGLRRLHAMYPNWSFIIDKTGLDWETAAEAESQKGTSAIHNSYPSLMFRDETYPNGILIDGYSWYAPAKDAVKYYLDPRNFLTERNIFMFESLSYNEALDSSVSSVLSGSFMDDTFIDDNGNPKTYASAFILAAKAANISSTFLASRALLEMGSTKSAAASGTVEGYEGIYNFYNIGAYSGTDNYLKGLAYAKNMGWNSIQKAITGGAKFISESYINKGQDTIYFQKFNVSKNRVANAFTHQYQTNILAGYSESSNIYISYKAKGKLQNNYTFKIPVFDNMPSSAFKVSRTDTVGGTVYQEPSNDQPSNNKDTVTPEQKVYNAGYSFTNGFITKLKYGIDVSEMRADLEKQNASVGYMDSAWNTKTSGKIATGDLISIDNKVYILSVYGDISGDGIINIKDLLLIQKYLLKSQDLTSANLLAADVSKDGAVTIKDLLLVQKYLLGNSNIEQ